MHESVSALVQQSVEIKAIQHPQSAAYIILEAAKLATYNAAKMNHASGKYNHINPQAVGIAANSAKYLAAEAAFTACE